MLVKERIESQLSLLKDKTGNQVARLEAENGMLELLLTVVEPLACSLQQIKYTSSRSNDASGEELQKRAEQLASDLTYLLESVATIEVDSELGSIQLRSASPERDGERTRYYELLVSRTGTLLCRYEKSPGASRQAVPFTLTREVLVRVAQDLERSGV